MKRMSVKELYEYIVNNNTIGTDIQKLEENGYKELRHALRLNDIPVIIADGDNEAGWGQKLVSFRSEQIFDNFMEIWNPSEEYKAWAHDNC